MLPHLRELLRDSDEVELRRVETPEEAEAERFLGSPTLRINGEDVDPAAGQRADFGMKCRLYRTGDIHSPIPPEEWIRAGFERAR